MRIPTTEEPMESLPSPCCNKDLHAVGTRPIRAETRTIISKEEYLENMETAFKYETDTVIVRDGDEPYCAISRNSPPLVTILMCEKCDKQFYVQGQAWWDIEEPLK